MADAVLLDWEGLITDTTESRRAALALALAEVGVALDEEAYDDRFAGRSLRSIVASALEWRAGDDTLVELVTLRAQRELGARLAQGFAVEPHVMRLIEHAQLRAPVAVVTAAGRDETDAALRLAGLRDLSNLPHAQRKPPKRAVQP